MIEILPGNWLASGFRLVGVRVKGRKVEVGVVFPGEYSPTRFTHRFSTAIEAAKWARQIVEGTS